MTTACDCGRAWLVRSSNLSGSTLYCGHCDRPCAGVAGPGRCDACDRMKVKR